MTNHNYLLSRATLMVLRTFERDLIGNKIPDIIVDNLIHDLSCFDNKVHLLIIDLIKTDQAKFARRAYDLWKIGELSVLKLTNELTAAEIIPFAA